MIELDTIYNEDCLTGMQRIPDGSVDCIICDLPYGTMKGLSSALKGWDDSTVAWDDIIPTDQLFEQYERVLRMNGVAVLFSQEPYTSHLRTYQYRNTNFEFCYPLMWKKDRFGNNLMANKAPVSFFEDINVFAKRYDTSGHHPLRDYFANVQAFIGKAKRDIINEIGQRADHVFRGGGMQFALCTAETYQALIDAYHIDQMEGFKSYSELQAMDARFQRTFNLPEGQKYFGNVLEYAKDSGGVHPTQKPVDLIRKLVEVYSNPGDTILDNCMGSGTTAIACMRTKRHFIGFELNRDYYDIALRRIKLEQQQQTLF